MFFSSDTWEHTQKPQRTPRKLNKQTYKLMKQFSQISQLNGPNDNTVSCNYYDLALNHNLGGGFLGLCFEVGVLKLTYRLSKIC